MRYFYVYEKDVEKESINNIWAPLSSADGKIHKKCWSNIMSIKKGDIVYLTSQNGLVGKGIAKNNGYHVSLEETRGVPVSTNRNWSNDGQAVDLELQFFANIISLKKYIDQILSFNTGAGFPFATDGKNKQGGYCYKIQENFAQYLDMIIDADFVDKEVLNLFCGIAIDKKNKDDEVKLLVNNLEQIDVPENYQKFFELNFNSKGNNTDYLASTATKIKNGNNSEKAILIIEKKRLLNERKEKLIPDVIWASQDQRYGDGCGYDILSFEDDGTGNYVEKYIEVKSTTGGETVPFEISEKEVRFSKDNAAHYYIYRVCNSNSKKPLYFKIKGDVSENFNLVPTNFKAWQKESD